ncbi:MAG: hypothetical protein AAF465_14765 [Pseudomonadota bacterium]
MVIRRPDGELYTIGHRQCFYASIGIHAVCSEQNGQPDVSFDWARLEPDSDLDGVDDAADNCSVDFKSRQRVPSRSTPISSSTSN